MADVSLDNARDPEQLKEMERLQEERKCFFCDDYFLKKGLRDARLRLQYWFARDNDYPYAGTVNHCVIVPYRHVTRLTDLSSEEWAELLVMVARLQEVFGTQGESIFSRSGDMRYTGATLDHLHFHFLVGAPKPDDWKGLDDNILVTLGHKARS